MQRKMMLPILCGSVLLNAFLLGMMTPWIFHPHPHGGPDPIERMNAALPQLDEPYRDNVQKLMDAHKDSIAKRLDSLHSSFSTLPGLLTDPSMNLDDFKKADKAMTDNDAALHQEIGGLITDIAAALPAGQRVKFFKTALPPQDHFHGHDGPP